MTPVRRARPGWHPRTVLAWKLPADFWSVIEEDENQSLANFIAAFAVFALLLIVIFVYSVVLVPA